MRHHCTRRQGLLPFWPGAAPLFLLLLTALSATLVIVMIRVGTLDHPVARSSHVMPTPKGGGVGIAASFLAGTAWLIHVHVMRPTDSALLLGAALLAAASYLDDVRPAPAWVKFGAQMIAALIVVSAGDELHVVGLAGRIIHVPEWLALPATLIWIIYVTNAVNFMDGLNGLAAGSVAEAAVALAAAVHSLAPAALPLVAGIAGFLPFNFPRARIFMGDVGSQLCGFVIADLALRGELLASLVVPLSLLPMLADVAFTLVRRALAGAPLAQAHRGHLYQVANRAGVAAAQVTLLYWGMAAWGAACGVIAVRTPHVSAAVAIACAGLLPLPVWLAYVVRKAEQAGLESW